MTTDYALDDLDLAALISSRICHDIISPVGAISNGLEVLEEEEDQEVRAYAMDLIRKSTEQASAKLQFARLAFGAGGSAGSQIEIGSIQKIVAGIIDEEKHHFHWESSLDSLAKTHVKLLLNLIAVALTTLPRGGRIEALLSGHQASPNLVLQCEGVGGRIPKNLPHVLTGQVSQPLDTLSIQPFYAFRLARSSHMALDVRQMGQAIRISAAPQI